MIPLMFLLAFVAGYLDYRSRSFIQDSSFFWPRVWVFFGTAVLWTSVMYFFTRWYIKKLYGNYLKKLKEQFEELQVGN